MEVTGATPIRVQTLAQRKTPTVPPQYIQPPEQRPRPTSAAATIPLIDLSLSSDDVRREIAGACREWGAFHVVNHGVPKQLLDEMRAVGSSFFNDLDVSEKLKYSCDSSSAASEGYGSRMLVSKSDDTVLDWRDYFDHHTFPLSRRNPCRWPDYPPKYRYFPRIVDDYVSLCLRNDFFWGSGIYFFLLGVCHILGNYEQLSGENDYVLGDWYATQLNSTTQFFRSWS